MYFDIAPKAKREDLFGREYLLDSLHSHINDETVRMIVIKGLRRTGKTSLLNAALSEIKQKKVKIDIREAPYYDRKEFMSYLLEKIKTAIGETIFQKILKHISGIKLSYKDLSATFYLEIGKNFFSFFERLNEQFKKTFFVIAFDEVQLLRGIGFDNVLAAIFDNYKNIKLILTGSEIGLVDEFLGKRDARSALFGRAILELGVKKLSDDQTSQFLTEGFGQIKKEINLKEVREVIEVFDGIIGWATYYGWLRSKDNSSHNSILKVMEEGSKLIKIELEGFLEKRSKANYLRILRAVAKGYNRWSLFKNEFIKSGTSVSDRQLSLYLQELIDYSFLEKLNETYFITDPLLIRALD